jgi:beta-lactamase class D
MLRQNTFLFLITIVLWQSCTVNNVTIDDKLGRIFEGHQVTGTFGMFDNSRGEFTIYDLERFKAVASPGQTFDIFNTLVALHTGKLTDEKSLITDSTGNTLRIDSAFVHHSSSHFEKVAQLIGKDTMKFWVDSVKYGNRRIADGSHAFWNDTLKISPDEQLGLIKRLYFRQHPFRASVQESVKKMMIVENNSQHQLAYHTATIPVNGKQLGWVVGWIEENRHVYPFVLQFDAPVGIDVPSKGESLAKAILEDLGFFKGRM